MSQHRNDPRASDPDDHHDIDWEAVRRLPEYQRLRGMTVRIVAPITVLYLVGYFGFLVLAVTASHSLGGRLHGGFNLAFLLMCGVFVLVWLVAFCYVRLADGRLDAQAERVNAKVAQASGEHGKEPRP